MNFFLLVLYVKSSILRGNEKNYLRFKGYYYFYFKIIFKSGTKRI